MVEDPQWIACSYSLSSLRNARFDLLHLVTVLLEVVRTELACLGHVEQAEL